MKSGVGTYQKINTMGMSQLELILTVYNGTIGFLNRAKSDFKNNQLSSGRSACDKARKCLVHLYTTLDMDKGMQIAQNLGQLYTYMIEQVDLAVASKSEDQIDDVIHVLMTLKEGWEGLRSEAKVDPGRTPESPELPEKTNSKTSVGSQAGRRSITLSA